MSNYQNNSRKRSYNQLDNQNNGNRDNQYKNHGNHNNRSHDNHRNNNNNQSQSHNNYGNNNYNNNNNEYHRSDQPREQPSYRNTSNNVLNPEQPPPRKRSKFQMSSMSAASKDQEICKSHYDSRRDGDPNERAQSAIFQSRKLNNWIKSVLIGMFCHRGSAVLDMCGGKGGDLNKWSAQGIEELVLVDHAVNSVIDCRMRYNSSLSKSHINYPLKLVCCDAFQKKISDVLPNDLYFDLVSSQFAIHYAFETKERVKAMLTNVTERLREGGYFIGTIPDANVLVRKWRRCNPGTHRYGNSVYSVEFKCVNDIMKEYKKLWIDSGSTGSSSFICSSSASVESGEIKEDDDDDGVDMNDNDNKKDVFDHCGIRYTFNLNDAVDCPEHLLHFESFVKMAAEEPFNLELVLDCNFHEFFVRYYSCPEFNSLLGKMGIIAQNRQTSSIDNDQWDVAYLYKVFAFRKKIVNNQVYPERKVPSSRTLTDDDIECFE